MAVVDRNLYALAEKTVIRRGEPGHSERKNIEGSECEGVKKWKLEEHRRNHFSRTASFISFLINSQFSPKTVKALNSN